VCVDAGSCTELLRPKVARAKTNGVPMSKDHHQMAAPPKNWVLRKVKTNRAGERGAKAEEEEEENAPLQLLFARSLSCFPLFPCACAFLPRQSDETRRLGGLKMLMRKVTRAGGPALTEQKWHVRGKKKNRLLQARRDPHIHHESGK
jgi:hypothetical protein